MNGIKAEKRDKKKKAENENFREKRFYFEGHYCKENQG